MKKKFEVKDYLPVSTIKSYFSRRAKKVRTGQISVLPDSTDSDDEIEDEQTNDNESTERENTTLVIQHIINKGPNFLPDNWVAVAFPRAWYPGQFIRDDEEAT